MAKQIRGDIIKTFAHFLTAYRKVLFIVVAIASLVSACMIPFVTINQDMTRYIPSYMQTRIGMDIMSDEFGGESEFRIMFEGVPADQQSQLAEDLKTVTGITTVQYDSSSDYHNGDMTLYKLGASGGTYSDEAWQVYKDLQTFGDSTGYAYYLDSAVIDARLVNIEMIILAGMTILIIILFIMSKSWIEPLLMLLTLGLAVGLNYGTNIIFDSISNTTFQIAAVFQLVLSLDYSVMLMNRYREERAKTDDTALAMQNALRNAFGSIVSSSVTTFAGLVCLVLMSFTFGADMGLVLAKGVFFSLVCVFTVMPALVVWFDRLILKTAKPVPLPAMKIMTAVGYKARYVILTLFVVLVASGLMLRSTTTPSFVLPSLNTDHMVVQEYFPSGSQVVVMYDRADEEAMTEVDQVVANMKGVKSVSSYATTLGKSYTADGLANALGIDKSFVNMLYYRMNHSSGYREISLRQLALLISKDVAQNSSFSSQMSGMDTSGMDALALLTTPGTVQAQRTPSSMKALFDQLASGGYSQGVEFSTDDIKQLYLLYYLKNFAPPSKTTSVEFAQFMLDEALNSSLLQEYLTPSERDLIRELAPMAQIERVTTPLNVEKMIYKTKMSEEIVTKVYEKEQVQEMSIQQFYTALIGWHIPEVSSEDLAKIQKYLDVINASIEGANLDAESLAQLFKLDETKVRQFMLYLAYSGNGGNSWTASMYDVVSFLVSDEGQSAIKEYGGDSASAFDSAALSQLKTMLKLMDEGIAGTTYSPQAMYSRLQKLMSDFGMSGFDGLTQNKLELLYLYRDARDMYDDYQVEYLDSFIKYLANNVVNDPLFAGFISSDMRSELLESSKLVTDSKDYLVRLTRERTIIYTDFSSESEEMEVFLEDIWARYSQAATGSVYFIGEGPMSADMTAGFMDEFNFITLITALVIFLIVLITFRNLLIPLILIAMIQGSFCWVMALNGLAGSPMYYMAIIVVQAILMGATIDYAILYTSHYRESRKTMDIRDSIAASYKGSIATMLTSGSILVIVLFILGVAMGGSAAAKICLAIAQGSALALVLVIFVLPGVLAACDRLVTSKDRYIKTRKKVEV